MSTDVELVRHSPIRAPNGSVRNPRAPMWDAWRSPDHAHASLASPPRRGRTPPHGARRRPRARRRARGARRLSGAARGDREGAGLGRRRGLAAGRRRRARAHGDVARGRGGAPHARAGRGAARALWADGRPAWCGGADAGPRMRAAFAFPVRGPAGRSRYGARRRGRSRVRRRPARHDGEPGLADRAVRRTRAGATRGAGERRAQERDPERGLRLHHHRGRRGPGGRAQPGHGDDVRLRRRRTWSGAS